MLLNIQGCAYILNFTIFPNKLVISYYRSNIYQKRYNKGYIIEKGRKLGYEIQGNDDSCTGTEELWRML